MKTRKLIVLLCKYEFLFNGAIMGEAKQNQMELRVEASLYYVSMVIFYT